MTSASDISIGQVIQQRREALGLSREGLAFKANVAHKTIERLEGGGVKPRRATLFVIQAALEQAEMEEAA